MTAITVPPGTSVASEQVLDGNAERRKPSPYARGSVRELDVHEVELGHEGRPISMTSRVYPALAAG